MLPALPKLEKLISGVTRVLGMNPSPFTLQGTNSYIIGQAPSTKRLLIDTSSPDIPDYIANMREYFRENNGASINRILLTHWHTDHIGALPDVLALNKELSGDQETAVTVCKFPSVKDDLHSELVNVEELIDGDMIDLTEYGLDEHVLKVLHTPGHSDDHACFVLFNGEICALFSGDLVLGHGTSVFEDLDDYMDSLLICREFSDSLDFIYPGHGREILEPSMKLNVYIAHRQERIDQVGKFLKRSCDWQNESTILKAIYPRDVLRNPVLKIGAYNNMIQVLEYFLDKKKVLKKEIEEQEEEEKNYIEGKEEKEKNEEEKNEKEKVEKEKNEEEKSEAKSEEEKNEEKSKETDEDETDEEIIYEEETDEEVTDEEVTDEEVTDEEVIDEKVTDEKVTDEEVTDEEVIDEKVTDEKVTDEEVTDEEVTDEEVTDEEVTDEEETDEETTDEDETYEDETYEDETYKDETYKDETYKDETYEDETYKDETYEDETYKDETYEKETDEEKEKEKEKNEEEKSEKEKDEEEKDEEEKNEEEKNKKEEKDEEEREKEVMWKWYQAN